MITNIYKNQKQIFTLVKTITKFRINEYNKIYKNVKFLTNKTNLTKSALWPLDTALLFELENY